MERTKDGEDPTSEQAPDTFRQHYAGTFVAKRYRAYNAPMTQAHRAADSEREPLPIEMIRCLAWMRRNHNAVTAMFTVGIFLATSIYTVFAIKQWLAMNESNAINRENVESVQRALVFFSGQTESIKRITGKKVTSLTIIVPWDNSGVTEAMNGVSRVNWKTLPSPNGLPPDFSFPDEGTVESRQFEIPPRSSGNGTMDVPIDSIEATKQGVTRMFIHGWITYDDIFKGQKGEERKTPRHLSEFCDEITNIKSVPDDVTDPNATITWELSLCPTHTCTDERCADYAQKISSAP
jgi:hypothetical protein